VESVHSRADSMSEIGHGVVALSDAAQVVENKAAIIALTFRKWCGKLVLRSPQAAEIRELKGR